MTMYRPPSWSILLVLLSTLAVPPVAQCGDPSQPVKPAEGQPVRILVAYHSLTATPSRWPVAWPREQRVPRRASCRSRKWRT